MADVEKPVEELFGQAQDGAELHLLRLRYEELLAVRHLLPPGARVLEMGTGNGFQARVLQLWGYDVSSVDVEDPLYQARWFKATYYDGVHMPFPDASFDVVFSSNCLEHVRQLPATLGEAARVLKPGGVAVHLVPSPSWRLFTLLTHFIALPGIIRRKLAPVAQATGGPGSAPVAQQAPGTLLFKLLGLPPHGEFPTSLHEIWFYRRGYWKPLLVASGLDLVSVAPSPLFYTGNMVGMSLTMRARRALARLLGAACSVYCLRKPTSPRGPRLSHGS